MPFSIERSIPKERSFGGLILPLGMLLAGLALTVSTPALAQDSHYWTLTYGARASLLGGAVIGSVMDLSATYYNPGALPLVEELDVVMTSTVFNYPNVWLKGIGGTDTDIKSSNFTTVPVVVAGMFRVDWHGSNRVGYSVLSRQRVRLDFNAHDVEGAFALPEGGDLTAFAGDFHLSEDLSETWVGVCWARSLRNGIGLGFTAFGTFRHHEASKGVTTQGLDENGDLAYTRSSQFYRYSDYGLLMKAGVSFGIQGISCGMTLTTPNVSIYSDAEVGNNTTLSGYDLDETPGMDTYMAAQFQDGLSAHYKMPFSLGGGLNYTWRNTSLHLSAEYFFPVGRYEVIPAEDYLGQTQGDTLSAGVTHEARGVLNFAAGVEQALSENVKAYASFFTDFASRKDGSNTSMSVSDWDIYNVMVGSDFRVMEASFILGLGLGWGGKSREGAGPIPVGGIDDVSFVRAASFTYRMYKFALGFSF